MLVLGTLSEAGGSELLLLAPLSPHAARRRMSATNQQLPLEEGGHRITGDGAAAGGPQEQ